MLAVYQDGTRIGGDWVKFQGSSPVLKAPGIDGPLRLPLDGMRSIDVLRHDGRAREKDAGAGTLEMDGLRLVGHLADSDERPGESSLAWRPLASDSASEAPPRDLGKDRLPGPAPQGRGRPPDRHQPRRGPAQRRRRHDRRPPAGPSNPAARRPASTDRRSIYLRTGDIIPSEVDSIDEDGVRFKTEFSASTFVPNARVKAIELAPEVGTIIRVNKAKRERLLTLPRMQKDSPPTHLIRSKNGDFLRGRLLAMDDKTVRVEVRLEEKEIPRDRVSRIIWLHADETDPSKKPAEPPDAARTTRVQAVRTDGIRLTFVAERFEPTGPYRARATSWAPAGSAPRTSTSSSSAARSRRRRPSSPTRTGSSRTPPSPSRPRRTRARPAPNPPSSASPPPTSRSTCSAARSSTWPTTRGR